MIEQFFRPDSVEQALELKRRYQDEAVWFAGGSKLNATPTRTDKKIAISLQDLELDWIDWDNGALRIGAMSRLQPLRDARFIPAALREALGFVYSRHVRNQSTIGGEIAARQEESVLLPVLLALDAELVFGNGETLSIEDYLACPCDRLLTEIIIKDPYRTCATRKISRSQAGLTVVTAAVAITDLTVCELRWMASPVKHCVCMMLKLKIWKAMHWNRLSPTPFSRRKICGAAWPINAISREFW